MLDIVGRAARTAKSAGGKPLTKAQISLGCWSNFGLIPAHRFVSACARKVCRLKALDAFHCSHGVQGVEGSNPFTPTKNKKQINGLGPQVLARFSLGLTNSNES